MGKERKGGGISLPSGRPKRKKNKKDAFSLATLVPLNSELFPRFFDRFPTSFRWEDNLKHPTFPS